MHAARAYDIPAGQATETLAQFSAQTGPEVRLLYAADVVRGVTTQAVNGRFTTRDALERMLARTPLVVAENAEAGAFVIRRRAVASSAPPKSAPDPNSTSSTSVSAMNPKKTFASLLSAIALALSPAHSADGIATGTIQGRVFETSTGSSLANVRVAIKGETREVLTDATGEYRISGVPAGEVEITATYLGVPTQRAVVTVTGGGVTRREFEFAFAQKAGPNAPGETVKLDVFTVAASREMSARAISLNEQRNAPNLKNVVAIDEFGDRGAENIGEFLQFLPGVAVATSGSEHTSVSLRGFPGNNSNILLDGGEVASSFAGNTRAMDLREMPMNNVSRVEVTKVPTPDMPASGLGGSINLISRNGFEARSPKFSFNAYTQFHNRNGLTFDGGRRNHNSDNSPDFIQPSFDFSYLHPVNSRLAFTIGGSRAWRFKPMESGNTTDEVPTWDLVRLVQTSSDWRSLAQTFKTLQGSVGIDWRISPTDTLSVSFNYRDYDLYITRSGLTFAYGAGATGGPTFTQGTDAAVGTVTMSGNGENNNVITETRHYTLKYRHRGDTWRWDLNGSFSGSASDRREIDEGIFFLSPATLTGIVLRGDDIPGSGGTIPTRYSATRGGVPVDVYDGANYTIGNPSTNQPDWNAHKHAVRLDLARDFRTKIPFTLKVGGAVDTYTSDQRRYAKTWNFRPNGSTNPADRLASRFDVFDEAYNADAPTVFGRKARWISSPKLFAIYQANPSWFVLDDAQIHQDFVNNSRRLKETISAGYLRADARLFDNRLWLVAGVRYERTNNKGSGPLNDINAQFQRNTNGSFVDGDANQPGVQRVLVTTDPLALRKLRFKERAASSERTYDGYYPSVNASFNITDNLIVRGAYAQTIGRPNINFIIPGTTISEPDAAVPTINVNNAGLEPWSARSYDLSLESYHPKDGLASVGVFRKNIKDFFGTLNAQATPDLLAAYGLENDPALLNYTIATRTNAGDAEIDGLELAYRQSLTFLPDWARGLQVFANYTKLKLSGNNTADFAGYFPQSFTSGVGFVRGRVALKATLSYLGHTRLAAVATGATIPAGTFNYQARRVRIGVNASYNLTPRYSLYASLVDWGGFVTDLQRYAPATPHYAKPSRWQELGFYTNIGVRGTF